MLKRLLIVMVALCGPLTWANPPPVETNLAIIKTGKVSVRQGLVFSGGSWTEVVDSNFSAFLIQHGQDRILFDTGLGKDIDAQYRQDMRTWESAFFRYEQPIDPVRDQLARAGLPAVTNIVLSHAHCDHASGINDFPLAQVYAHQAETALAHHGQSGISHAWPSQVAASVGHWRALAFTPQTYEGFDHSLDWFEDGSVVFVPLGGHTAGSVGVFVNLTSGRRIFLVGDAVWSAQALGTGSAKFALARWLVDDNADKTQQVLEHIRGLMRKYPSMVVLPAHDGPLQERLGYFPAWVR